MKKRPKAKPMEQPEADPAPQKEPEEPVRLYLPLRAKNELRLEAARARTSMADLVRRWTLERLGFTEEKETK